MFSLLGCENKRGNSQWTRRRGAPVKKQARTRRLVRDVVPRVLVRHLVHAYVRRLRRDGCDPRGGPLSRRVSRPCGSPATPACTLPPPLGVANNHRRTPLSLSMEEKKNTGRGKHRPQRATASRWSAAEATPTSPRRATATRTKTPRRGFFTPASSRPCWMIRKPVFLGFSLSLVRRQGRRAFAKTCASATRRGHPQAVGVHGPVRAVALLHHCTLLAQLRRGRRRSRRRRRHRRG